MKSIKSCLQYLNQHLNVEIKSLSKNSKIKRYLDFLGKQDIEDLNKAIQQCFWPSELESGTVGSFLFGCRQSYYGDVSVECSPLCIGSLPIDDQVCQEQVWTLDNKLNILKDREDSTKAKIYNNFGFNGLNGEQINMFKTNNIKNI